MRGEHTVRHAGYLVCYWSGNTACGNGDPWDRAEISADTFWPKLTVKTQYELGEITALLDKVFNNGQAKAKQDIRDVLGIERKWP